MAENGVIGLTVNSGSPTAPAVGYSKIWTEDVNIIKMISSSGSVGGINLANYTLTIPATGTPALLGVANIFTSDSNSFQGILGKYIKITRSADTLGAYYTSNTYRNSTFSGGLIVMHARGTSGSPAYLNSGDRVASLYFKGYDGTESNGGNSAKIEIFASENHSGSSIPGYISFGTTSPGSLDTTEIVTISPAGLTISANNIVTDTTTGMKIGTATNQKIGFFNAIPVVQAAHITNATGAADVITRCNAILVVLENLGFTASA